MAYKGKFNSTDELNAAIGAGNVSAGDFVIVEEEAFVYDKTEGWVQAETTNENGYSNNKSLAETLQKLVDSGYLFGGLLGPLSTLPLGVLDEHKVFFLATTEGVYNISGLNLKKDEVAIIYHKQRGVYSYEKLDFAKKSTLEEIVEALGSLRTELKNVIMTFDGISDAAVYNGKTSRVEKILYNSRINHFVAVSGNTEYYEWDGWEFWNNENGSARTEKLYINSANHSLYHFEDAALVSGICLAVDSEDDTEYEDV